MYVKLHGSDVGMFRFMLEGEENLALATTLERDTAVVKVSFAPESKAQVLRTLTQIRRTLDISWLECPGKGIWRS